MHDATTRLTPSGASLLRQVASTEITRHYDGTGEPVFTQDGRRMTAVGDINALFWLIETDFVRVVGERGRTGLREGPLHTTELGAAWLDAHRW